MASRVRQRAGISTAFCLQYSVTKLREHNSFEPYPAVSVKLWEVTNHLTIEELRSLLVDLSDDISVERRGLAEDPSSDRLHDFRIKTRSARALISLTRESFTSGELDDVRASGAQLSRQTSRARNLDVILDHWVDLTIDLDSNAESELDRVRDHLQLIRDREYRKITALLKMPGSEVFESSLRDVARLPAVPSRADELVRRSIKRTNKRIIKTAAALSGSASDDLFHRCRKDLKKLRYSLELTRMHFPHRTLDKFIDTLSALQTRLGRHQDAVMFSTELWSAARELAPAVGPDCLVSIGILLGPIEDIRKDSRRKSIPKIRAFAGDDVQRKLKKLIGNID